MMWHHYSSGMPFPAGGLLLLLLVAAAAGLTAWALLRRPPAGEGHDADRILAERYARGEIDDEEYERRRHRLRTP